MKVVVDDKIPFIKDKIETLADEILYKHGADISPEDVKDADILIVRTRTHCDRNLLEGSKIKYIVTATIGYDHLDIDYLKERGIKWTNCPGCNAPSVRQYVHNSLLALGLAHKPLTMGIVGVGHVGSLIAEDALSLGMNVLLCDPPRQDRNDFFQNMPFVSLEEIAEKSDIISFHTPLIKSGKYCTIHIADKNFLESLQRSPLIINTSRGAVVDNMALLEALKCGKVSNAIIDTWENEPNINLELLEKCVIGTPHIAGYSADGKANATRMTLKAVCDYLGKPFNIEVVPPMLPQDRRPTSSDPDILEIQLYDPRIDSEMLKKTPEDFEHFRGCYPLRRETVD